MACRLHRTLLLTLTGAALALVACDDGTSTGNGAGTPGGGGATLADAPTSLPGRIAGNARNVGEMVEQASGNAAGLANELNGGGGNVSVKGLSWTVPGAWESQTPNNSMRAAQFNIPGTRGGATVYWASAGGSVEANVDRWAAQVLNEYGQAGSPRTNTRSIAGSDVTLVELEGTFMDGLPGGAQTERRRYALRGAIIEGPRGLVFIKMTGPDKTIEAAEGAWSQLIGSMRADR